MATATPDTPGLAPHISARVWVGLAVLLAVGGGLRLAGLRDQGLLYGAEEGYLLAAERLLSSAHTVVGDAAPPPIGQDGFARGVAPHTVAWSGLLAVGMSIIAEPDEGVGRFTAAGCGIALVLVAFFAGRAWFRDAAGALALSAVCALMPSFVWWSRLGLPNMFVLLLLFAGLALLLRAAAAPRRTASAAASGALFATAAATDGTAWPVVLVAGLYLVVTQFRANNRRAGPRTVFLWAGGCAVVGGAAMALPPGFAQSPPAVSGNLALSDVTYFSYWFFHREGVVTCLLLGVGLLSLLRLSLARAVCLLGLIMVPAAIVMLAHRGDPLPRYPFAPVYLGLALLAAGGLRALVSLRPAGLGIAVAGVVVVLLGTAAAPLARTHSGTRELAAWLTRDAQAWWHSQGTAEAAVLISSRIVPPVRYATRTHWRTAWWEDPPAEARTILSRTSAYLFIVGEEGHLLPEWGHVQPMQHFSRTLPRPAMYVSETPGSTRSKQVRLRAGAYESLAAYDAATVAAHAHDAVVLGTVATPYLRALPAPARFTLDPLPEDAAAWRREFRAALADTLGLPRIPRTPDVRPRVSGRTRAAGYTRERVEIETEPGFRVPALVLLPDGEGPHRFVLALHGHGPGKLLVAGITSGPEDVEAIAAERRDFALQLVRLGYAVIAPDLRGFGELRLPRDVARGLAFSCPRLQSQAQLVGRTLIGDRVHDAMRWIDYARTRPDMDTTRVTIVGHSAGGTVALFTAALDERVDVAFVSGYFGTFAATLGSFELCECNYAPGLARVGDLPAVAALVAPRRLRFSLGRLDGINPAAAARAAIVRTERAFDVAGGRVDLLFGDLGHIVYPAHLSGLLEEPPSPAGRDSHT